MATAQQISQRLNVSFATLAKWREQGLPFEKIKGVFQYDPAAVAAWLLDTGNAVLEKTTSDTITSQPVVDGPVHTKIRECAVYFGVHERTVKGWLTDPTFPGRAGKAGDPNTLKGFFPAKAIAEWLTKSGKRSKVQIPAELEVASQPVVPTPRDRLVDVKTEQAMLELKRMQGKMIDAEVAIALFRRTNAYAATVFKMFPQQMQAELPAGLDDRTRAVIFTIAQKVINQARKTLADMIERDEDDEFYDRSINHECT